MVVVAPSVVVPAEAVVVVAFAAVEAAAVVVAVDAAAVVVATAITGSAAPGTLTKGTVTVACELASLNAKACLIVSAIAVLNAALLFKAAAVVPVGTVKPTVSRPKMVVASSAAKAGVSGAVVVVVVEGQTNSVTFCNAVVVVLSVELVVVTFTSEVTLVQPDEGGTVTVVVLVPAVVLSAVVLPLAFAIPMKAKRAILMELRWNIILTGKNCTT